MLTAPVDTSYVLWQWCMKHPEARDICDIATYLFASLINITLQCSCDFNDLYSLEFHG